jgi:hypothetical protein
MVWGIGQRLAGIDMEAPPAGLHPALNQMAVEAGEILLATGRFCSDPAWVLDEANDATRASERYVAQREPHGRPSTNLGTRSRPSGGVFRRGWLWRGNALAL